MTVIVNRERYNVWEEVIFGKKKTNQMGMESLLIIL